MTTKERLIQAVQMTGNALEMTRTLACHIGIGFFEEGMCSTSENPTYSQRIITELVGYEAPTLLRRSTSGFHAPDKILAGLLPVYYSDPGEFEKSEIITPLSNKILKGIGDTLDRDLRAEDWFTKYPGCFKPSASNALFSTSAFGGYQDLFWSILQQYCFKYQPHLAATRIVQVCETSRKILTTSDVVFDHGNVGYALGPMNEPYRWARQERGSERLPTSKLLHEIRLAGKNWPHLGYYWEFNIPDEGWGKLNSLFADAVRLLPSLYNHLKSVILDTAGGIAKLIVVGDSKDAPHMGLIMPEQEMRNLAALLAG